MRILCIGDTSIKDGDRPCSGLANAAIEGSISITMSGPEGVAETLRRSHYDIAVLQQSAPETRLIKHIRNSREPTPVIVIAQETSPRTVADVLSVGADDCVPSSIEPVELLARLRAIVRRIGGHDSMTLHIGRLTVCVDRRETHVDDKLVPLTRREYDVVELLALRKGQVLSKETVLDSLYAGESEPHGKVIDVMICKIRKKMRKVGVDDPFTTLWGIGYRLNEKAFAPLGTRATAKNSNPVQSAKETCLPVRSGINILSNASTLDISR